MAALNMHDLKEYVTENDSRMYDNLDSRLVSLLITHSNLKQKWPEIKVSRHTTVGELKDKLYNHGGTTTCFQKLYLKDTMGNPVACLNDDSLKLGFFGIENGMNIHIEDLDPYSLSKNGGLEDVSLVKKYVMPDEEYSKRENSLREYKKKMRQKDPYWTFLPENRREPSSKFNIEENKKKASKLSIGMRCEVMPGKRRGNIRWVGENEKLREGFWVGIEFDEPVGKNDGSIKEERLFTCQMKYGAFVRPDKVQQGDFPERDIDDELTSSDEEYVL